MLATNPTEIAFLSRRASFENCERFVDAPCDVIAVAALQALLDALSIDVDAKKERAIHRRGERLGAAHSAHAAGDDELAFQVSAKVLAAGLGEGFVGSLHDALAADVDPRSGGHLPIHHQALAFELVEMLPVGPAADEIGICEQDARRGLMRAQHADGLARLDEQGFVIGEGLERAHDGFEGFPVARGLAGSAVDDQIFGALGHFGIEIVHQHAQRGFLLPSAGIQLRASGRANLSRSAVSGMVLSSPAIESSFTNLLRELVDFSGQHAVFPELRDNLSHHGGGAFHLVRRL